jgi:hypothetical protein
MEFDLPKGKNKPRHKSSLNLNRRRPNAILVPALLPTLFTHTGVALANSKAV